MNFEKKRSAAKDVPPGTIVRLPEELAEGGGLVGYKSFSDAEMSYVMVPGAGSLSRIGVPKGAHLEVLATPGELANACLTGRLARISRRWKKARTTVEGDLVELRSGAKPGDGKEAI